MITICVCAQKGGVSKTTTSEALILFLRKQGYSVLALDLDLQGNMSAYFNPDHKFDAFDFVENRIKPSDIIEKDLIAGGPRLTYLNEFFEKNPLDTVKTIIKDNNIEYDFMVIDTPPAINKVVLSALSISDFVITPTEATKDALDGVLQTIKAVEAINRQVNAELKIMGVLITKYKDRYKLHRKFKVALDRNDQVKVFKTTIRESQAINTAKTYRKSFYESEYAHSKAVEDYERWGKEVLDCLGLKK